MPIQKLFLIFALITSYVTSFAQVLTFDITLYGSKVGVMTAERRDSAGFKLYIVKTSMEAKLLFAKKSSESVMKVTYNNQGNLLSSFYKNVKSDGTITTTSRVENGNLNVEHNGKKSVVDGTVSLSSVQLYFSKPQKFQKIFSERAGKLFDIQPQNDGTYIAGLDDGSAKFTYTGNRLAQIEVSKGMLGTIVIKLAQ